MALKKSLWMIALISLLGLIYGRLKPADMTLNIAFDRFALEPGEHLEIPIYHATKKHPFLNEAAIARVTFGTQENTISLRLEHIDAPEKAGSLYASTLSLAFPWTQSPAPLLWDDATLTLDLINGDSVVFSGFHGGIFPADTLESMSLEVMYGIFEDEAFQGLYIGVKNRTVNPLTLAHVSLGFTDLYAASESMRVTDDAFMPGARLEEYSTRPLASFAPGETQYMIMPFSPQRPVTELPVCVGFNLNHQVIEECINPFLFIQRRVLETDMQAGVYHDRD